MNKKIIVATFLVAGIFYSPKTHAMMIDPSLEIDIFNRLHLIDKDAAIRVFNVDDIKTTLEQANNAAMDIEDEIQNLNDLLYRNDTGKDDIVKATQEAQEKLRIIQANIASLTEKLGDSASKITLRGKVKSQKCFITEDNADQNTYTLNITIPEFKQEDLTVSIEPNEDDSKFLYQLALRGKKQDEASCNFYSSSSIVNGKQRLIEYNRGELAILIDLPRNIDTQENSYTMAFNKENETLTIKFSKKEDATTKQLKYTETK